MKYLIIFSIFILYSCSISTKDKVQTNFNKEILKIQNHRSLQYQDFILNTVSISNFNFCKELHRYNFKYGNYNKKMFLENLILENPTLYNFLIKDNFSFIIRDTLMDDSLRENLWVSTNIKLLSNEKMNLPYYEIKPSNFDKNNFYLGSCDDGNEIFNYPIEFYRNNERVEINLKRERWRKIYYEELNKENNSFLLHVKIYPSGEYTVWKVLNLNNQQISNILDLIKNYFPEYQEFDYAIFKIDRRFGYIPYKGSIN